LYGTSFGKKWKRNWENVVVRRDCITGGLAVGGASGSATEILNPGLTCTVAPSAGYRNGTNGDTKFGWTVGAGAELMMDKYWSVGLCAKPYCVLLNRPSNTPSRSDTAFPSLIPATMATSSASR
jgi:hypothetical protein